MNICIITPFFNEYPNVMASAIKIAQSLSHEHSVHVITSRTNNSKAFEKQGTVTIERLPAVMIPEPANYVFTRGLLRHLWKYRNETDVYLLNKYMWPTSWSILVLKLFRKKVIVLLDSFQGYDWWTRSKLVNIGLWFYARTIGRCIMSLADCVILFHEGLEARAKKLGIKYEVIHNGIFLETFQSAKPASDIVEADFITITFVGRLDGIKGYDDLMIVAQSLVNKYETVRFILVGSSTNSNKKITSPHPRIIFTGPRKDVPNILRASDIFVLPSYAEGLPNVVMEAMASKLACVVSNVGGSQYLIEHEKNGFLFTPGDQKKLFEYLEDLIINKDKRNIFAESAFKKIDRDFNWHSIVKKYDKLFTSI